MFMNDRGKIGARFQIRTDRGLGNLSQILNMLCAPAISRHTKGIVSRAMPFLVDDIHPRFFLVTLDGGLTKAKWLILGYFRRWHYAMTSVCQS
jgi:hypothetical protein